MEHLEQQVTDSAAVVQAWSNAIARLETELNTANLAVLRAKKQREAHGLKAAMGDAVAQAAVRDARQEQQSAEATIGDLEISLPQARTELASAEKAAAGARAELAGFMARHLMRKRVEVACKIDSAIADLAKLLLEFESLGRDISNADTRTNMFGMSSNHESAIGLRRVRAAFGGKIFDRIFPNAQYDEMKKQSLATAEATHWNLPAAEEVKAA
jgi:hypothetical protein